MTARGDARDAPPSAVVLGGTGWVGRQVCDAFARHGYRVRAVARGASTPADGRPFTPLDVVRAAPARLAALLAEARADVVVNAVDAANATDGWERPEAAFEEANVAAVRRLTEAVGSLPSPPRLVHIGTVHEYGPVPPGTSVAETATPCPSHPYARTRLAGTRAVLAAAATGAFGATVLRLVNVYGPGPSPASFPGKLCALLAEAAEGRRPELRLAPARRDWVDVRDVAEAVLLAAARPATGTALNIGGGTALPTRELVSHGLRAARLTEAALDLRDGPVPGMGADWIRADVRRAAEVLGWRARTGPATAVGDMWREYAARAVAP